MLPVENASTGSPFGSRASDEDRELTFSAVLRPLKLNEEVGSCGRRAHARHQTEAQPDVVRAHQERAAGPAGPTPVRPGRQQHVIDIRLVREAALSNDSGRSERVPTVARGPDHYIVFDIASCHDVDDATRRHHREGLIGRGQVTPAR